MLETRDEESGSISLASELTVILSGFESGVAMAPEEVPGDGLDGGLGLFVLPAGAGFADLVLTVVDFPDVASIVVPFPTFQTLFKPSSHTIKF